MMQKNRETHEGINGQAASVMVDADASTTTIDPSALLTLRIAYLEYELATERFQRLAAARDAAAQLVAIQGPICQEKTEVWNSQLVQAREQAHQPPTARIDFVRGCWAVEG